MQLFRRKIVCNVCIAQNNYAPFQKTGGKFSPFEKELIGAAVISFEKSFSDHCTLEES
jgi:hypothetical protein